MKFLTAHWTNLLLATYPVPDAILEPHLPPGLELDTRDGQAFASLVAFQYSNTRVLGVPWPGYRDFCELNLRFYARRQGEGGVVFIKEFVPQRLTAWVARVFYNEPFAVAPLAATIQNEPERMHVEYRLERAGKEHVLAATGRKPAEIPPEGSAEHFFKEQRWGYGRNRRGRAIRYEVTHPPWEIYPVGSYRIELDWAAAYGKEWEFMQKKEPCSVMLVAGSTVAVYPMGEMSL